MRTPSGLALVVFAFGLAVSGCYSKATAYDGKFTFAYASMVEHDNFVKPIAPGAKLEVHAFANGTQDYLTLKSARSLRPDVVAVQSVKEKSLVLVGKTPGVAEIELTATDASGAEVVDKMFFHVAKPAKHGLGHWCTEEPEAAYVVGDEVVVNHDMKTADKRSVVGFDYLPITVEPRGALQLVHQPQAGGYYAFTAKSAKKVTLRSNIDDKTLTLKVVERRDLTDATLFYGERMIEGRGAYIVAEVHAGETTLCSQNALTKARSLTPDICKVTAKLDEDPDEGESNREQLARITALAFGVCKFEMTLPELANGKGVVLSGEVKVGREQWPGEGRVDERVRAVLADWSRPMTTMSGMKDALAILVLALLLVRRQRSSDAAR